MSQDHAIAGGIAGVGVLPQLGGVIAHFQGCPLDVATNEGTLILIAIGVIWKLLVWKFAIPPEVLPATAVPTNHTEGAA